MQCQPIQIYDYDALSSQFCMMLANYKFDQYRLKIMY